MAETNEQIDFTWKGKDKTGKVVTGEAAALSITIARTDLRRQGIRVISIKKKPKPLFSKAAATITTKDISIFARQLATMLDSGVPLVQSFDIIGKGHDNPSMAEMLLNIKTDIESGDTLAQALGKRPLQFDELFCNLVDAGEQAGVLESLLDKIATYKEKSESIKAKVKKALTYPIAVVVVAFIVTAILLIFVVPVFKDLFDSFGAELPSFTLFVMGLSDWMVAYWYYLVGSIIAIVQTFGYFKRRSKPFNYFIDRTLLKLPVIGLILNKSAIARFARTFSTMFKAGVPLVEAMESVAGATGNIVFSEATMVMRDDVSTGTQLNKAMSDVDLFPNMVIQMVAIGEESGALDSMLAKVADFYEREVDDAVDNMTALMEPLIMVVLGGLIGTLVIAMYLPIFKLGAVV